MAFGVLIVLPVPGLAAKAAALILFLSGSITDWLDGYIARKHGLITQLGRLLDPVADKLLTFSAFCGFLVLGLVPAWMVAIIVLRDLLITGLRLMMPAGSKMVEAQASGKHKTAIQFTAILATLGYLVWRETPSWRPEWLERSHDVIYWVMLFVVVNTVYSGVRYLYANRDFFLQYK